MCGSVSRSSFSRSATPVVKAAVSSVADFQAQVQSVSKKARTARVNEAALPARVIVTLTPAAANAIREYNDSAVEALRNSLQAIVIKA